MMNWNNYHTQSELYASEAEIAYQQGDVETSHRLYRLAADQETKALHTIDSNKMRTVGITAVSASSLWFKAGEYRRAEKIAYQSLINDALPPFAQLQLQEILQAIWDKRKEKIQRNDKQSEDMVADQFAYTR